MEQDDLVELIRKAVSVLPADVESALKTAAESESSDRAKILLNNMLDNVVVARREKIPLCQDTGVLFFYVKVPSGADIPLIKNAIVDATRKATVDVPLRPNAVHPLSRANSGDNTGAGLPVIDFEFHDKNTVEIVVLPKGAGAENFSALKMLDPADGVGGIKDFVVDTVVNAGGRVCPPVVVGVGLGGSSDRALSLAKRSLLREIGSINPVKEFADLEKDLKKRINSSGVGPMGVGGDCSCLDVHVDYAFCHTASLPVAVNLSCWALRRSFVSFSL